jgi:hypothetical protein
MVAGCSVTEGVGLPEDQIWHSLLIEKFIQNNDTNRPIAKLNIGKSASGIDSIIRYIYVSIEKYGAKPDLIYLLLPNIIRQELIIDDYMATDNDTDIITPIIFKVLPNYSIPHFYSKTQKECIEMNYKIIVNNVRQVYHNIFKSLLFLKYYLEVKKIPWFFSSWSNDFTEAGVKSYLPNIDIKDINIPREIYQHYVNIDFSGYHDHGHRYHMARDGMHLGLPYHLNFSNKVYENIINNPMFLEVRNKWKT